MPASVAPGMLYFPPPRSHIQNISFPSRNHLTARLDAGYVDDADVMVPKTPSDGTAVALPDPKESTSPDDRASFIDGFSFHTAVNVYAVFVRVKDAPKDTLPVYPPVTAQWENVYPSLVGAPTVSTVSSGSRCLVMVVPLFHVIRHISGYTSTVVDALADSSIQVPPNADLA